MQADIAIAVAGAIAALGSVVASGFSVRCAKEANRIANRALAANPLDITMFWKVIYREHKDEPVIGLRFLGARPVRNVNIEVRLKGTLVGRIQLEECPVDGVIPLDELECHGQVFGYVTGEGRIHENPLRCAISWKDPFMGVLDGAIDCAVPRNAYPYGDDRSGYTKWGLALPMGSTE